MNLSLSASLALTALLSPITAPTLPSSPVPARLQGTWRITRSLPTHAVACWDDTRARQLLHTNLVYRPHSMHWRGGEVPLQDAFTREITAQEFRQENTGADFAQLGIHTSPITEVDLQHEDTDITGATTEVPGDSILLATPNRIIISACHVFYEATRLTEAP